MSRFYGAIKGSRGMATRQGTPKSGMVGHIRGWNIGAEVRMYVDQNGEDACQVLVTGGSNNRGQCQSLGIFRAKDLS